MSARHPYESLPQHAFWRPAVAERHLADLERLANVRPPRPEESVATAGSCFAQHIGRHLILRGARYLDLEPAPDFLSEAEARRHGFGLYSCRYGNIYTARQLVQLLEEALGRREPLERVWTKGGARCFDALRPSVDPVGHESAEAVLAVREHHLSRVRALFEKLDVFVFTLGLTEAWEAISDGTAYPTCPGTIAGEFDATRYRFRNYRYPDVMEDLQTFWRSLRAINAKARMILTVSPVPLTATASGDHVLVATTQSKATLRAVAGDLAAAEPDIEYFPSYELIASHPSRAMFFNPDLRTVNDAGVELVMSHFFGSASMPSPAADDLVCDEEELDAFSEQG